MKYLEIAKILTRRILSGTYEGVVKLPSETALIKEFNTSKMTIRKALQLLIDSGIIFSIPKSGYYINSNDDIKKFNALTGNSFSFLNKGDKIKSNVISFNIVKADNKFQKIFNNFQLEYLYEIKRIRYQEAKLKSLETIYLNPILFKDFTREIATGSIYNYIQSLGYSIASNIKTVRAGFAPKEYTTFEPSLIDKPLLEIENIGYLTTGTIFEYSLSYNIDQAFSTVIKFNNILKEDE